MSPMVTAGRDPYGRRRGPRPPDPRPAGGRSVAVDPPPAPPATPRGRIVGGVGALLASRLGVDALWIRLLFVVLTLVSGVGIIAYAACWLALVVGPRRPGARIAGGVLLVAGVPFVLLASGDGPFISGPWAILLLLGGLAAALWQPRRPARADVRAAPRGAVPRRRRPRSSMPRPASARRSVDWCSVSPSSWRPAVP